MVHKKGWFAWFWAFSAFLLLLAFTACDLISAPKSSGYGSLDYILADKNALVSAVGSATNTLEIALRTLDDNNLVNTLNSLASKGVQVKVLIDSDYSSSGAMLGPKVALKTGNPLGDMDENFIVIDRSRVLVLSTAFTSSNRFLALSLAQEKLIGDFTNEFYQMFRDGRFGSGCDVYQGKISLIQNHHYHIGDEDIELYFLPQDSVIKELSLQTVQYRKNLTVYSSLMANTAVYRYWKDAMDYGAPFNLFLSSDSAQALSNMPAILNNSNAVMTALPFNMNAQFADIGEPDQSVVLTSFNYGDNDYLNRSDGLLVKITGPAVSNIQNDVKSFIGGLGTTNPASTGLTAQINVGYTNVIISEINWDGVVYNGQNDYYACFIELKNITTNIMDISGFRLWITNINDQADPELYVIPYGVMLKPGSFYVVSEVPYAFSYYDDIWTGMYIYYQGFTAALVDPLGNVIDSVGKITGAPFKGGTGTSMVRVLNPLGAGRVASDWYAATNTVNVYSSYTNNKATPGSD